MKKYNSLEICKQFQRYFQSVLLVKSSYRYILIDNKTGTTQINLQLNSILFIQYSHVTLDDVSVVSRFNIFSVEMKKVCHLNKQNQSLSSFCNDHQRTFLLWWGRNLSVFEIINQHATQKCTKQMSIQIKTIFSLPLVLLRKDLNKTHSLKLPISSRFSQHFSFLILK